jgi:hypothetical protein
VPETDHERLADKLEEELRKLERHSEEVEREVKEARDDWERKRADPGVPGAPAPAREQDETSAPEETPG